MSAGQHILVVDGDLPLLQHITIVLEKEGFQVQPERDGLSALEWLHRNDPPAVIVLEMRLQRLDGWSLWSRVRFLRGASRVPIVIMSEDQFMGVRAQGIGAAAFLHKPFGPEDLIQKVRGALYTPSMVGER